ncbi:MAG: hypothetical protein PHQ58_19690 [Rhodoferax sp.]|nr:hypothetical protein [Rhodoferax sp.]
MNPTTIYKTAAAALACSFLLACGGGGGSPTPFVDPVPPGGDSSTPAPLPDPVPPITLTGITAQGLWQSGAGAETVTSTVVTDNGQVWSVFTTAGATRLVKASLAASGTGFTGTGKAFVLGANTVEAIILTATAVAKSSLSGSISSTAQTESYSLAYQSRYDTPITVASFAGSWSATLGPGTVNWTISNSGVITGTRTTGCTYTGQVSLRPEAKAVVDAVITESCPTVTQLSGIAVKSADNTGITLLMTTTGDAQAVVIGLH